jgi:hypothetical protein
VPATTTARKGFFILGLSGNSPTSLYRCDRPLRGRQLALHHRVKVWAAALYSLGGAAGAWWASYTATLPVDHHVPWEEFYTAFRAHHLSTGLLRSKLKEFMDLEQGTTVYFTTRDSSILWLNLADITLIRMRRRPTCTVQGSPSTCRSVWYISPTCHTTSWQVQPLIKKG